MSKKSFLRPFAATVGALLAASGAGATVPSNSASEPAFQVPSNVAGAGDLVLNHAFADLQFAVHGSHASHASHSSHASHASHSSHASSSF